MLNPRRVEMIRTMGMPDTHWARIWRLRAQTIHAARVGRTWANHPTPPDTKPRVHQGNWGDTKENT